MLARRRSPCDDRAAGHLDSRLRHLDPMIGNLGCRALVTIVQQLSEDRNCQLALVAALLFGELLRCDRALSDPVVQVGQEHP